MSLMAEVGELFWQLFPFSQQLKLLGKQWAPPLDAFLSAPLQICIYVYVTLWPSNPITVITWAVFEASNSCGFVCFLLYFCFSQLSFSLGSFMGVRLMPEPKKKSQREYYQQQKLFFLPFLIFLFEIDRPCLMDFHVLIWATKNYILRKVGNWLEEVCLGVKSKWVNGMGRLWKGDPVDNPRMRNFRS